ncbi:phosphatidylglycerophosphatase A [Aestuariicoccus sp. MJ-SS9]|uniref:phosphatidylglycerophosphatase A family protein n=1 Tax=Aestuariicoccus sp. MJ-SS9 TaxID=3079855 RepID=UPI00290CFFBA|nr:phosphatidylglycerophosphatase A [Aestuariicoccus sp. MJ-SS9]MDU8911524.1 phosphatidylglycerophosphatase A [Aestuariicoccus sp. MJ-SS9]
MKAIASFLYVGYLRPAPGTWGSLAALPVAWGIHQIGGFWLLLNLTVFVFLSGYIATAKVTAGQEDHDPSWIVIDEVAGQWIALFPVSYGAMLMSADITRLWPGWIAAFVLFRLFDIWKPGPIGRADRMGGPMGVMLDDVVAGVFAALGVIVLAAIGHGVML